jgi:hypothetical protein
MEANNITISKHQTVLMRNYLGIKIEVTQDQLLAIREEQAAEELPFLLDHISP